MIVDIPFSLQVHHDSRFHVADTRMGEEGSFPAEGSDLHRRFTRRLEARFKEEFPEISDVQVLGDYRISSYTIPTGIIQIAAENSDVFIGHLFLLKSLEKTYRTLILSAYDIFKDSIEPSQLKIVNPMPGRWSDLPSKRQPQWVLNAPFDINEAKSISDKVVPTAYAASSLPMQADRDDAVAAPKGTSKPVPVWLDRFINWSFYAIIISLAAFWTWQSNRREEDRYSLLLEAIQDTKKSTTPDIRHEVIINMPAQQVEPSPPTYEGTSDESTPEVRIFSNGHEE